MHVFATVEALKLVVEQASIVDVQLGRAGIERLAEHNGGQFVLFVELNLRAARFASVDKLNSGLVELELGTVEQDSIGLFIDLNFYENFYFFKNFSELYFLF